jgi:hypothetical protein
MTQPPDYATSPFYSPVHGEMPSTYNWQNLSQEQIASLRNNLINSILQVFVMAARGVLTPGGLLNTLEQVSDIFEGVLGVDFLEGDWSDLLNGLLSGDQAVNVLSLFGSLPQQLFSWIPINILSTPQTAPMVAGTFPDAASVSGAGLWSWNPSVTRSVDGTGSMQVTANGTMKAARGAPITVGDGQKITPSMWVKWTGYVGAGATVQLQVIRFSGTVASPTELGITTIDSITPTAGSGGWSELTGDYSITDSNVTHIRTRIVVTADASVGTLNFDDGTYTLSSNFIENLSSWWQILDIGDLFGDPNSFDPTDLIPVPVRDTIDTIFEAISGVANLGTALDDLLGILQNIPTGNILGVGGPLNIGLSLLESWSQLVGGFVGTIGSGAGLADLFNIGNIIGSQSALGAFSWDILGIRNNKTMATGMLPTSVSPIALTDIGSGASATTFGVTSSAATVLWHRFEEAMSLGVISWLGGGTTSITDMRVNIWKMDPSTGDAELIHNSANIIGDVNATTNYNTYEIPTPIAVEATDVYGAEIEVRAGAGTHNVVGKQMWLPSHPTVYPRKFWSKRNSGGSAPPSTIASGSVDYATTNMPTIEFAVETGPGTEFHEPQRLQFTSSGSTVVPNWANFVDRILVAPGGGGNGGSTQIGLDGEGGDNGAWASGTLARGTHFTGTPTVTVTLGTPGGGGGLASDGGNATNSTIAVTGASTLTAIGGTGGNSLVVGSASNGQSPGNLNYGGVTYAGGGVQSTNGADGAPYGGGGAGGGYFGSGGDGAASSAWLVFRQS